jgi:hypothetical protein
VGSARIDGTVTGAVRHGKQPHAPFRGALVGLHAIRRVTQDQSGGRTQSNAGCLQRRASADPVGPASRVVRTYPSPVRTAPGLVI